MASIAQKYVVVRGCHQDVNFGSKLILNCVKTMIGGNEWVLNYREIEMQYLTQIGAGFIPTF